MDAPVRKKKHVVATEKKEEVKLPEEGPYCPKCQHEYGPGDIERTQAFLAVQAEIIVECPECTRKSIPVLKFEEPPKNGKKAPRPTAIEPGVKRIIDSIFTIDYEATWKKLHEALVIGDKRNDYATVNKHLDLVEDRAREAHLLYINMKKELDGFLIDHEIVWSAMWDHANAKLQGEKAAGNRNKTITDADVRAKMAEEHPDEFKSQEMQKKHFELAVKHAENFSERWAQKARDLNTILTRLK